MGFRKQTSILVNIKGEKVKLVDMRKGIFDKIEKLQLKDRNIVVTGGAGFIGSHLAQELTRIGANVIIFDNVMRGEESFKNLKEIFECQNHPKFINGDIMDFEKVREAIKGADLVFHLAALPSHRRALERPREYMLVDVAGTVNVLEAARITEPCPSVVFASSNKVYGKQQVPFVEDMMPKPEGPYGLAKYCSEETCKMYAKYYGLNIPVIRYHHVIGPRCQPDRELSIFTERVINDKPPIVHGHFNPEEHFESCAADYTNIYDAVVGTILTSSIKGFDVFNLATGKVTTVLRLAELVIEILEKPHIKPEFREMLKHESLIHWSDVSKMNRILGFKAECAVEESIKEYVEWRLKTGPRAQAIYV